MNNVISMQDFVAKVNTQATNVKVRNIINMSLGLGMDQDEAEEMARMVLDNQDLGSSGYSI